MRMKSTSQTEHLTIVEPQYPSIDQRSVEQKRRMIVTYSVGLVANAIGRRRGKYAAASLQTMSPFRCLPIMLNLIWGLFIKQPRLCNNAF